MAIVFETQAAHHSMRPRLGAARRAPRDVEQRTDQPAFSRAMRISPWKEAGELDLQHAQSR